MAETYDDKAILGAQLQVLMEDVATDLNGKQDSLDLEVDVPNKALKFNNVTFTVNTGGIAHG